MIKHNWLTIVIRLVKLSGASLLVDTNAIHLGTLYWDICFHTVLAIWFLFLIYVRSKECIWHKEIHYKTKH